MQNIVATDNLETTPESVTLHHKAVNYATAAHGKAQSSRLANGYNYVKSRVFPSEESKVELEYAVPKLLTKSCSNYKNDDGD